MNRWLFFSLILLGSSHVFAGEPQQLLYLSERGPILIELHVEVNGKPYDTPWNEFVEQLFDDLDHDDDGVLNGAEAQKIPNAQQLPQLGLTVRTPTQPPTGSVDRETFAAYLQKVTGGPFSVNSGPAPAQTRQVFYANRAPSGQVDLFPKLDRDSDQKLGPEDFDLTSQLQKLDINDDENIARAELMPTASPYYLSPAVAVQNNKNPDQPFLHLADPQLTSVAVVRKLLAKYDTGSKDSALTRAELNMSEKTFARRDADTNGQLDFDELRQWLRGGTPNLKVTVRLNGDSKKAGIEAKTSDDAEFDGKLHNATGPAPQLAVGKVRIEFGMPGGAGYRVNIEDQYRMLFGQFDRDNNGYLDKAESQQSNFRNSFELIDRDDDGKVFIKELLAFVKQMTQGAESRVVLTIADRGNQLFRILDRNDDQRLNRRELRGGRARIDEWDEDGDQRITVGEVPRNWHLSVSRGAANQGPYAFAVVATQGNVPTGGAASAGGPVWFRKMDSNQDGDLTRREFLGRREDFDRIDANSDDVIDAGEAKTVSGK